jgi:hypothetical protein
VGGPSATTGQEGAEMKPLQFLSFAFINLLWIAGIVLVAASFAFGLLFAMTALLCWILAVLMEIREILMKQAGVNQEPIRQALRHDEPIPLK